jgi:hypothetical protein
MNLMVLCPCLGDIGEIADTAVPDTARYLARGVRARGGQTPGGAKVWGQHGVLLLDFWSGVRGSGTLTTTEHV